MAPEADHDDRGAREHRSDPRAERSRHLQEGADSDERDALEHHAGDDRRDTDRRLERSFDVAA